MVSQCCRVDLKLNQKGEYVELKKVIYLFIVSSNIQNFTSNSSEMKKAIVIGASSGMGREIVKRLSQEGYIVGLAARRLPLLESLQRL